MKKRGGLSLDQQYTVVWTVLKRAQNGGYYLVRRLQTAGSRQTVDFDKKVTRDPLT